MRIAHMATGLVLAVVTACSSPQKLETIDVLPTTPTQQLAENSESEIHDFTQPLLVDGQLPRPTDKPTLVHLSREGGASEIVLDDCVVAVNDRGGFRIVVSLETEAGVPVCTAANGSLTVNRNHRIVVAGDGLQPESTVTVWMFSEPKQLGSMQVVSAGSVTRRFGVPKDLVDGPHTLQINALDSFGEVRSFNLLVALMGTPKIASVTSTTPSSNTTTTGSASTAIRIRTRSSATSPTVPPTRTTSSSTTTTTTVAPTPTVTPIPLSVTYGVTYNGNLNSGGAAPVDATAYPSGATVTVAGNTGALSRPGYVFGGWCTAPPDAGAVCGGTLRAVASTFFITSNTTLYAVWETQTHTVSYAAGGGSGSAPVAPTNVVSGATFTVPANTFARTGRTFIGWSDGTNVYAAGSTYPATGGVSDDVVLSATWSDLTCETGGACVVGNTGPGGGTVFYVQAGDGTFNCGPTLSQKCKYLEAAPTNWQQHSSINIAAAGDPKRAWAAFGNQSDAVPLPGATSNSIGQGYRNSVAIAAQSGNSAGSSAAVLARAYSGGSRGDWYLPNEVELEQLHSARATVGGFANDLYWSARERNATSAGTRNFFNGTTGATTKGSAYHVRPVRAFHNQLIAPAFTLSSAAETVVESSAISGYTVSSTGGEVASWSISPAAPTGLTFNSATGLLSGTPTTPQVATTYTITASNDSGSASQTFTLTVDALACADGGACAVGDTGPGGGIVFYVAGSSFTSAGSDCDTNCRYLEAASSDQSASANWCNDQLNGLSVTSTAIGSGMSNTTTASASCTSGAIRIAMDYTNNGKSDWHLPSKDELAELFARRDNVGGFATELYWSSSERFTWSAWSQWFSSGVQSDNHKGLSVRVRVVRAF